MFFCEVEKTSPTRVHWDVLPCGVCKDRALHLLVLDVHGQAACVWPAVVQGHLGDCERWEGLTVSKGESGHSYEAYLQQGDGVYQAPALQLFVVRAGVHKPLQWKKCLKFNHTVARGVHVNGFICPDNLGRA